MPARGVGVKRRLMAILLLTSGIVMVLTCAALSIYEYVKFRSTATRELTTIGRIITSNTTAALAFRDADDAAEVLSALKAEQRVVRACLYDQTGAVFATYPVAEPLSMFPPAPEPDGVRFAESKVLGFLPVAQRADHRLGTLYLESDLAAVLERFRSYGVIVLLVMLLSFLAAYFVSSRLQEQISRPVLALTAAAQAFSERRDYSVRAPPSTVDEFSRLTDAFNGMLGAIEEQTQALQTLNQELERRVRERTAALEAAVDEIESFSYSVSHDLRAPLRHVAGYVEMLRIKAADQLSGDGLRYLNTITEATSEMAHLIDDLLEFSRMGRAELSRGIVSLDGIVESALRQFELATRDREVEWSIDSLPDVIGDSSMLKHVLTNLIDNALKYSRHANPARIEIGCAGNEAGRVVFYVRDNGAGFDMRYVGKLFGVFQRLHHAAEYEGTGIGLATVRRIIDRHGGRVWGEGKIGRGATIYFTLEPATSRH